MKTILITGSTDGIGKLAALSLAQAGHQLILHGRNPQKLAATVQEVTSQTGNANVSGVQADFSNLREVQEMGAQLQQEDVQLDVLINNAGVFNSPVQRNADGLDLRMVVNYLAPYLLTKMLAPVVQNRPGSRIVNLSSAAQAPVALAFLRGTQALSAQSAYAQSKLALTMWSFHLANQLPGTSVVAVNPGSLLNTKMVREAYGQSWSSADKGASLLHDLAVGSAFNGISGAYFDNDLGNPRGDWGRAHADAYDPEKIRALIVATEELLGEVLEK